MAKKAKQQWIEDTEPKDISEVTEAAENYKTERDKRMAMTVEEKEAKAVLIEVMKKHDLDIYKFNGYTVTRTHEEKDDVKVKQTDVSGKGIDE
jgi:uncharacterized protein YllA (UPF0747 family)